MLTAKELVITEMTATALVEGMGKGKLSAKKEVVAFLKRAVLGRQVLNYATEFMVEEGIGRIQGGGGKVSSSL
jgi:hypothetical protein